MPAVRLFLAPGACSLAPHILLHHVGVPFERVNVAFAEGEHLTEAFARINPKKRIPILVLDGEIITEVPAIATAISDLVPGDQLMGASPLERARVYEWMNWLSGNLHGQGFGLFWRPERASDDVDDHPAVKDKARRFIGECFTFIEERLQGLHAVGDHFTAVDAYLLVFYRWGNGVGFDMARSYPAYSALAKHLVQLQPVAAALAAEGIDAFRDTPLAG